MARSKHIWNYRSWKFGWRKNHWRGLCIACGVRYQTKRKDDMLRHIDHHCNASLECNGKKAVR